jgi:hypothetical protein
MNSHQSLVDEMGAKFDEIGHVLRQCESKGAAPAFSAKFGDLSLRWANLQGHLQEKYLHVYSLIESSGASIFLKLAESVQPPWQRGISATNKVPYYIK